jgi:hypothetical protein
MPQAVIISAAKTVDQAGCLQHCLDLEARIQHDGHDIDYLTIEPLSGDWHSPEAEGHFRSGCAPIEALSRARELIHGGSSAVLIHGEDNIKSDYPRHERSQRMAIYGEDYPLTEAYDDLARRFIVQHSIDEAQFRSLAAQLFENHKLSYRNVLNDDFCPTLLPGEKWYQPVTSLFRGVDCANPVVDFSGRLLIVEASLADTLGVEPQERIEIRGVGINRLEGDGRDYLHQIADYDHLRLAYLDCCKQAGIEFADEFRQGKGLLEAYTCYPVVPMAFLLASGLVDVLEQIPEFLQRHSITVTGGMNLARAPWNNPALNALITMHHRLLDGEETYGMIHGNGGLGYRQGVALLAKTKV